MAEAATEPETEAPDTDQPSTELADTRGASILVPARFGFDEQQITAIRATVAQDCNNAELVMFLEVAARYELDPFAKQIFAAKIDNRVQIIVSRDGLLAHAHRQADFKGLIGDVVHENDTFQISYEDGVRKISHTYAQKERGNLLGAWAEVHREGHEPTFFYAKLDEYARTGKTPWAKQTSAMILKVAETYALRKAYSVSGVVGEEEMQRPEGRAPANLTAAPELDFGNDDLGQRLTDLFDEANTVVPGSYRPAKVESLLSGPAEDLDERREALANELADFIAEHTVVDAVVVEDPEPEAVHDAG